MYFCLKCYPACIPTSSCITDILSRSFLPFKNISTQKTLWLTTQDGRLQTPAALFSGECFPFDVLWCIGGNDQVSLVITREISLDILTSTDQVAAACHEEHLRSRIHFQNDGGGEKIYKFSAIFVKLVSYGTCRFFTLDIQWCLARLLVNSNIDNWYQITDMYKIYPRHIKIRAVSINLTKRGNPTANQTTFDYLV